MKMSVKVTLVVLMVTIAGASVGTLVAVRAIRASMIGSLLRQSERNVLTYAAGIESYLHHAQEFVAASAKDPTLRVLLASPDPASAAQPIFVPDLVSGEGLFEYLFLARPDGSAVAVSPSTLSRGDGSFAGALWFKVVLASGSTLSSDLTVSPFTKKPSVIVATPILSDDGSTIGVWGGGLRLSNFSTFLARRIEGGRSSGLITDSRGLVVAHELRPEFVLSQTDLSSVPAVKKAINGITGSGTWSNEVDEIDKFGAYAPVGDSGWAAVYATPSSAALAPIERITGLIIKIMGIVTLFIGLTTFLLTFRVMRPLKTVAAAAERIAGGDLSTAIESSGGPEMAQLAASFNSMIGSLNQRDASLKAYATSLEGSNAELSAFAYSVSHDLRAPLRSIKGFLQIILDNPSNGLDPEGAGYMARVVKATEKMADIIDGLLGLSRITRATLNHEEIDISAMAAEIAEELTSGDPDRNVSVEVEPGMLGSGDPELVRQALANLIGNAWKFTAKVPDASIKIGGRGTEANPIYVHDNGAGFDPAFADKLFQPFQRLHTRTDFDGDGIGLATVSRIASRHFGRVWAQSSPGQGATFFLTLSSEPARVEGLARSAGERGGNR